MASGNPAAAHQDLKKVSTTEFQLKKNLLLLATLVATVTYAVGLHQPGGVWQETQDGHHAGDPILRDNHNLRYTIFHYCNAAAFMASLVVCLLLLVLDKDNDILAAVLRLVMVLDLFGLMGAYAAGSCRDVFTTIVSSVLVLTLFAYISFVFFNYIYHDKLKGTHENEAKDAEKPDREVLMLLATFAVTLTYVAGLSPPGGFWSSTEDDHRVSDPVLQDHHPERYKAFFVCNTTAFVASLVIIVLLLDKKLGKERWPARFVALYGFIVVSLFGLVGAYIAGSSRKRDNTIYVACLAAAILIYITIQEAIGIQRSNKEKKKNLGEQKNKASQCNDPKLNRLTIPRITAAIIFFLSQKKSSSGSEKKYDKGMEKSRELVMLLATLVVGITYQAGLDPPGGLWSDNTDGHKVGDPILQTTHPARYKVFFYSNSTAFVASLIVIMMVQSRFLLERHILEAAMLLDLFGLIVAYASGSCRDASTSIYVVAIAGAVLVYVVIHIIFFTLDDKNNSQDQDFDGKHEMLLLLAILAATLTYQAGLTPPGGFWPANDKLGHQAGFPVLLENYPRRYKAFFYCNAASFMASVALILLLVNPNLYLPAIQCYALYVCMVAGMFGLMGAYAAGSARRLRSSIFVLALVAAVLAVVAVLMLIFWIIPWMKNKWKKENNPEQGETGTSQSSENASGPRKGPPKARDDKEERSEYLMLLGILAANLTYQSGLKPPGGLWQDNKMGHLAGDPVLHDLNKRRYLAFLYSNSTSFMASIVVIVMLLPWKLHNIKLQLWPMHTAILLDMFGILGAYAAGSARDWETSRNVILLVIPVLAYIAAAFIVHIWKGRLKSEENAGHNPQHAGENK